MERKVTNEYETAKAAWDAANLSPLWESAVSHKPNEECEETRHWRWSEIRPLLDDAVRLVSPDKVERRVLTLRNPRETRRGSDTTTPGINAAIQILLPGETARPHRHTIDALRFVIEGEGAVTRVNGKDLLMETGDLILTPGMTWHQHVHSGAKPIIWLDVLNGPLHRFLGTASFEPGPANSLPPVIEDSAFAHANFAPMLDGATFPHSPVFRYAASQASAALQSTPIGVRGSRRLRYVNPQNGKAAIPLIDAYLTGLDAGVTTKEAVSNCNSIFLVDKGSGSSKIGDREIEWGEKDIFTVPAGNRARHTAGAESVRLFEVSDREVLSKLGLLQEEVFST